MTDTESRTVETVETAEKVESPETVETVETAETPPETAETPVETAETLPETAETPSETPSETAETPPETAEREETPSEADAEAQKAAEYELSSLRQQLEELRERFEQQREAFSRMSRECDEFSELYPDRPLTSLPREVWESVRAGVPLAAAYAYSEARRTHALRLAEAANERGASASAGDLGGSTDDYFSPAEVRRMSAAEVRANYSRIMDSMKLWS